RPCKRGAWPILGLEQDGVPAGQARAVRLDAVGDLDRGAPLLVHPAGDPDADVGCALARTAEPRGDQAGRALADGGGVAGGEWGFLEDELGCDDALRGRRRSGNCGQERHKEGGGYQSTHVASIIPGNDLTNSLHFSRGASTPHWTGVRRG